MQASQNAIKLIKEFEGFSPKVYLCPAGKPSIGYGHLIREGEIFTTINQTQGEILLKRDLRMAEKTIDSSLSCDLTQNEFDALCSLIFNIGGNNFRKSTVARLLNEDNYMDGADAILMWNKVTNPKTGEKEISKGLERRREAERALFLKDEA